MKFSELLLAAIIIFFFLWAVRIYFDIPIVLWSASKNQCVKIMYDGEEIDCSELPERYERIWVK